MRGKSYPKGVVTVCKSGGDSWYGTTFKISTRHLAKGGSLEFHCPPTFLRRFGENTVAPRHLLTIYFFPFSQVESATGATTVLPPRQGQDGDAKDRKELSMLSEVDAAAAAAAVDRAEAAERVEYADEDSGGDGMPKNMSKSRELRSTLLTAVQDSGVGKWEAKVRRHDKVLVAGCFPCSTCF